MDPTAVPTPSPTAAWIAAALAAITLPIAAHPIRVLNRQDKAVGYPGSIATKARIRWVWYFTIAAHVCLIAYAVACATAEACDGQPPDYGWYSKVSVCLNDQTNAVSGQMEILVGPVYPSVMLSTYIRLDPARETTRHWTFINHACIVWISLITFIHSVSETGFVIQSFVRESDQGPFLRAWIDIYEAWGGRLFQVWFLTLVITGVASLTLTIRLIPWLQKREGSSASRESREQGIPSGSATSRVSGGTLLVSDPPLATTAPPHKHPSTNSFKSLDWLQSPTRHLRSRAKSDARSATRARLHACLRRLRVCLGLIMLVLLWNVVMVFARPFPSVLHVTSGWVSCRMISVLLFAATREVRLAVVTRRQIPNTEAGTLAATGEWDAGAESRGG